MNKYLKAKEDRFSKNVIQGIINDSKLEWVKIINILFYYLFSQEIFKNQL